LLQLGPHSPHSPPGRARAPFCTSRHNYARGAKNPVASSSWGKRKLLASSRVNLLSHPTLPCVPLPSLALSLSLFPRLFTVMGRSRGRAEDAHGMGKTFFFASPRLISLRLRGIESLAFHAPSLLSCYLSPSLHPLALIKATCVCRRHRERGKETYLRRAKAKVMAAAK